jgi:PST family polysaccharide transporter
MLTGLVTTKFVAVLIGPSGMALTGQFFNITSIITLLATAACTTGLIKVLAEGKEENKRKIADTVFAITGATALALSLITLLFSGYLSRTVVMNGEYRIVFLLYGSLLFFSIQNVLFTAILNGIGRIKEMTLLTITGSVLNMISVVAFAYKFGVMGVLISSSVSNVLLWFVGFSFVRKHGLSPTLSRPKPDKVVLKSLLGFSLMSLIAGLLLPSIQFLIRTKLIQQFSTHDAGMWQATMRLSDYYLNFVYSVLSIYYLPKLSSIHDPVELRKEILAGYLRIVPIVLLITVMIWVMRYFIINTFLSKEFLDIIPLLRLYLVGDVLKIVSWILAFLMWAKALKRLYIYTELSFFILNIVLNFLFINLYGLIGTGIAYIVVYAFYTLLIFAVLRKYLYLPKKLA